MNHSVAKDTAKMTNKIIQSINGEFFTKDFSNHKNSEIFGLVIDNVLNTTIDKSDPENFTTTAEANIQKAIDEGFDAVSFGKLGNNKLWNDLVKNGY